MEKLSGPVLTKMLQLYMKFVDNPKTNDSAKFAGGACCLPVGAKFAGGLEGLPVGQEVCRWGR